MRNSATNINIQCQENEEQCDQNKHTVYQKYAEEYDKNANTPCEQNAERLTYRRQKSTVVDVPHR